MTGLRGPFSVSPIIALLDCRRPPAVVRRVWAVVVDAIKCVAIGARPHVREEVLVAVAPAVAHRDATASPVLIPSMGDVEAPSPQVAPALVFRRAAAARLVSMFCRAESNFLVLEAAATLRGARSKMLRSNAFNGAAIAATQPILHAAAWRGLWNNNQATEPLLTKIHQLHGSPSITPTWAQKCL